MFKKQWYGVAGMVAGVLLAGSVIAAPTLTGEDVVRKSQTLFQGKDQRSTVTLQLINSDGSERKIVTKRLWLDTGGAKGIGAKTIFFTMFPPDSKGVGFLIWDTSDSKKKDELWLYLPSLRQVRRVNQRDQNEAFMGSDLTFADMGQRLLEEDTHTLVGEETIDGKDYYLVESVPVAESIYGKKKQWISKEDFTTLRIEYFDAKLDLLKTQDITWIRKGKLRVYRELNVHNVQTDHRTVYSISDLEIDVGLKDSDFSERSLKQGYRGR